jgi:hypothetical protein
MCLHLAVDDPPEFVSLLTGVGVDYDLLCQECAGCVSQSEHDRWRIAWRGDSAGPMWGCGGLLYVHGAAGLEVWEPGEGARIGLLAGFHPTGHDPATGAFAELADGSLRTWTPIPK